MAQPDIRVTIHTDADTPQFVKVRDFTQSSSQFVSLDIGAACIFLSDPTVIDALQQALTEARNLLTGANQ